MRWVFYSLIVINLLYLGWHLAVRIVPDSEPVPAAAAAAAAQLQLLSEAGLPEGGRERVVSLPSQCTAIGPWGSVAQAESAARGLHMLNPEIRRIRVLRDRLNWVYLPPAPSREEALRALADLQSRGVDSFVVSEGSNANAISLGYFGSADSAHGLKMRMQNAGFPAEVSETAREVAEFWLFAQPDVARAGQQSIDAYIRENPAIQVDQAACDDGEPVAP